jgi:hypothetical protein
MARDTWAIPTELVFPMVNGLRKHDTSFHPSRDGLSEVVMPEPPSDWEVLRDWTARCWEAEQERARQIESRTNLLVTLGLASAAAGTAFFGAGLRAPTRWWSWVLLATSVLGLVLTYCAFLQVLLRRDIYSPVLGRIVGWLPRWLVPDASPAVAPTDELLRPLAKLEEATLTLPAEMALTATIEAATRSSEENHGRERFVRGAQELLLVGMGLTLLFGALYTWTRGGALTPSRAAVVTQAGYQGGTPTPRVDAPRVTPTTTPGRVGEREGDDGQRAQDDAGRGQASSGS